MSKPFRAGVVGICLASLAMVGSGVAYAHHTAVSIGGSTTQDTVAFAATRSSPSIMFLTNYGVRIGCSIASFDGDVEQGAAMAVGTTIATIDSGSFGCSMSPFGISGAITNGEIKVRNHPASAGSNVDVTFTDFHASFQAIGGGACAFEVEGTLDAILKPGTGFRDAIVELVPAYVPLGNPVFGFDLEVTNVVGCLGEVMDGDQIGSIADVRSSNYPGAFAIDTAGVVSHG